MIYLFDIDGTLTEPQRPIEPEMIVALKNTRAAIRLVTGSTRDLIMNNGQYPHELQSVVPYVYACQGNECWNGDVMVYRDDTEFPQRLIDELTSLVEDSPYKPKVGHHIDHRPGMLNFSIPGRNSSKWQRQAYLEWDSYWGERKNLAMYLRQVYNEYDFRIGGEISIDIAKRGNDKSQVLDQIRKTCDDPIYFFGDKTMGGGNDYPLAQALIKEGDHNRVFQVNGPKQTMSLLKALYD